MAENPGSDPFRLDIVPEHEPLNPDKVHPKLEQFVLETVEQNEINNKKLQSHTRNRRESIFVDTQCGVGCFKPQWLQKFASKKAFMLVFSFLAVIQGMSWAYFTATITTLEKRFKISSQTAGIVMTGNELSQVLFSLLLSYYGSRGHRPRWISIGVLFSALSCFVLASPHLFYGAGDDALSLTEEFGHLFDHDGRLISENLPEVPLIGLDSRSNLSSILTDIDIKTTISSPSSSRRNKVQMCKLDSKPQSDGGSCGSGDTSIVPLVLIFVSQFVAGIGVLLFFSLGGPYLDDNIKKTQSPMLFGVTMSLRLVGPTLGFLLASACLKIYISPILTPIITTGDPRWMGAWWLGWVILGTLMVTTSFLIALFPRELPKAVERRKQERQQRRRSSIPNTNLIVPENPAELARVGSQIFHKSTEALDDAPMPKLEEFSSALKALMTNKINLYNNLSAVFYIFSAIGYWTYMPKYMETIFMQTAVSASAISGIVSIAFQAAGLLLSGFLISKYQPSARKLAGWNVLLGLLYVVVKITFTQMGCDPGEIAYGSINPDSGSWNLTSTCNADCNCKVNKMLPVCHHETNRVYYSACHAGCSSFYNGSTNILTDCTCLPNPSDTVTLGTCSEKCFSIFLVFLGVNAIIKFLDSSGRIGNMLVSYRCVDPKEKSLAIGLGIFLISIFAMLPAPILFGFIFDKMCLVWGSKCGSKGNCWLYDGQKLRYVFNLTAAAFTFVGAFFDGLVWYYVKDLDLYDEEKNIKQRRESRAHHQNQSETN